MDFSKKISKIIIKKAKKSKTFAKILQSAYRCMLSSKYRYFDHGNILIREYRAIYFPIPKVASSSLKKYISNLIATKRKDRLKIFDRHNEFQFLDFPHIKKSSLKYYSDFFKFAFVRSPYERLYSCYKNFIGKNHIRRNFEIYGSFWPGMTFKEFVYAVSEIPDEISDGHFKSQHQFLIDNGGNLIVDFVGNVENLNEDLREICNRTGMPYRRLSEENKRNPRKDKIEYDEETKNLVRKRYKKDIELFGYRI